MDNNTTEDPEALARRAYATAVKLLGPRDHSRHELGQKLLKRDFPEALVDTILDELESLKYLDDERYAQRFAEQRAGQGHGPLSIRAKLNQRGVDQHLISSAIAAIDLAWSEIACEVLLKKFTAEQLHDKEDRMRARIARFLASRGFSTSDALTGLKEACRQCANER